MRREIFVLPVVILIILGVFIFEKLQPPLEVSTITILSAGGTEPGDVASDFILEAVNGTDIRLDRFAGEKNVILHFWSVGAANELTQLQTIRNFYGDKVEILGITSANFSSARKITQSFGVKFIILVDPKDEVLQAYHAYTMPTTYFVNSNGVITDKKEGPLAERELNEKIKTLIK
ncbi:MAG: TlpA family protein disulfide reductase [Candidatus Aenigmarchaeota archaeon]|nr:TlpA family protein disulfide reductase [Candidatus Aenigmarchaeota archaeon]